MASNTNNDPSYHAMGTVFLIPELLEAILLFLGVKTLLVSVYDTVPILNPLLMGKFEPCFFNFGETYGCFRRASSFYELPWSPRSGLDLRMRTASAARTPFWKSYSNIAPLDEDIRINASKAAQLDGVAAQDEEISRRRFTRRGASWINIQFWYLSFPNKI